MGTLMKSPSLGNSLSKNHTLQDKVGGAERQGGQRHKVALNFKPLESGLCPVLRACGVVTHGNWSLETAATGKILMRFELNSRVCWNV